MTRPPSKLATFATTLVLLLTILPVAGMATYPGASPSWTPEDTNPQTGWTTRIPDQTPRPAPSTQPWWETTSRDLDRDGIVDWLEELSEPYPVGVSYDHEPTLQDKAALVSMSHEVRVTMTDAILIGLTAPEHYPLLAGLPGVVMVEPYGQVVLYGDVQTAASKARNSTEYPVGAWDLGVSGYGINIAVVDTGIDDGHPGLADKFVAGFDAVCTDDGSCMATQGQGDPNRYGTQTQRDDGGFNPDDKHMHGTACAGMATSTGADPNNPDSPDGVFMGGAPEARLVDVRIGTKIGAGPFENYLLAQEFYESAMNGLDWAIDHKDTEWSGEDEQWWGADIISLSWGITSHESGGSDGTDMHSRRLDEATQAGYVASVAAGNDGPNNDGFSGMGSSSLSITIGSTNDQNTVLRDDDTISGYSSRGPRRDNGDGYPYDELKPDVSTPGQNIIYAGACTNEVPYDRCDAEDESYSSSGSGTSFATPQAAGIMALMLEAKPTLAPEDVKEILRYTAERRGPATLPELDPFWNRDFGWGMINAYEAVKTTQLLDEDYIKDLNVELQAHITGESLTNYTSGGRSLEGLAWARVGTVERVEVSLDGERWWEVEYNETVNMVGTGEYIHWRVEVPRPWLSHDGEQILMVRSVSDGSYSVPDILEFNSGAGDEDDDDSNAKLLVLLAALALAGLLVTGIANKSKDEEEILEGERL